MPPQEVNEITEKIIGCAYKVSNTFGIGFVEKVYENALAVLTRQSGLTVEQHTQSKSCLKVLSSVNSLQTYLLKEEFLLS